MIVEPGKTYVRRVRSRTAERDTLAHRLRLGGALASMSLHPPGLPAASIVCVRRLRASSLAPFARRDDGRAVRAWEHSVASKLSSVAARASRPARGHVPDDAEAVIFEDIAELLACLASDFCRGLAAARWWWQSILRVTPDRHAVLRAWLEAPEHVPAALEILARSAEPTAFARALEASEARAVLLAVTSAFGLYELHAALEADGRNARAFDTPPQESTHASATSYDGAGVKAHDTPPSPWRQFAPESRAAGLDGARQTLLGIGLTLARAPHVVRSPSFARLWRDWLRAPRDTGTAAGANAQPSNAETRPGTDASEGFSPDASAPEAFASSGSVGREDGDMRSVEKGADVSPRESERDTRLAPAHGDSSSADADANLSAKLPAGPQPDDAARAGEDSTSVLREGVAPSNPDAPPESAETSEAAPDAVPAPFEAQARTRLGGIFFLVNVGLSLELYGDFTSPLRPGIALPVWDFVALLERRLYGAGVEGDEVWPLLARLSGREASDAPGKGFAAPSEWRVPPAWLKAFPERLACRCAAEGGRLRVLHPEGFRLVDVPLKAVDAVRQLADETRAYADALDFEQPPRVEHEGAAVCKAENVGEPRGDGEPRCKGGGELGDGGAELERWVGWLAGYTRARLRRALGLTRDDDPARVLCEYEARVDVTATRVDVVYELKRLPLEVRVAGLDRDPGWVPAAGRFVAFHFE